MTKYIIALACSLFLSTTAFAQRTNPAPDRASDPVQGYPITNQIRANAFKVFAEDFPNENVGFLHVYADPNVDPKEVYLMRGIPVSSTTRALLPEKFQRLAKTMNADLYGAAAITGINENLYLLRMDGPLEDRIEMFAIRGKNVKHLKTLAFRKCSEGSCAQLDTYVTDVDGDTRLDFVQLKRVSTKRGDRTAKPVAYVMDKNNRKLKRTKKLDLPLESMNFYDPAFDNQ